MTAVQVPPDHWVRGDYQPIAHLRCSAADIETRMGAKFIEGIEDQWGPFRAAGFQMPGGRRFGLTQYLRAPWELSLEVTCLHDDNFPSDLEDVLESLDMDLSDIARRDTGLAISPEAKLMPHALCRQDDNGIRNLLEVFPCRANASKRMRQFEASAHKQTYWIERHHE
jgi:hypothetical protein